MCNEAYVYRPQFNEGNVKENTLRVYSQYETQYSYRQKHLQTMEVDLAIHIPEVHIQNGDHDCLKWAL